MIAYVSFIQLMAYTMQSLGSLLLRKLEKIVPELSNQQVMKTLKLAIYVSELITLCLTAVKTDFPGATVVHGAHVRCGRVL